MPANLENLVVATGLEKVRFIPIPKKGNAKECSNHHTTALISQLRSFHCLFTLHAEYIIWSNGLDEAQAGIKIAGRNTNNLRYADDTILMARTEEELKSLLLKAKGE